MIAVTFLGSGSKGNAAVMEFGDKHFLLDAGLSCRRIQEGLDSLNLDFEKLDGIFITHEHDDHIRGLRVLLNKCWNMPVFASAGTLSALENKGINIENSVPLRTNGESEHGGLRIWAFPVQHDAVAPVGFRIEHAGKTISIATDLGCVTPIALGHLLDADILCLESNYDEEMLLHCSYPAWLKQRIRGKNGHLANIKVRGVLTRLQKPLKHLILVHVSQEANTAQLVRKNVEPLFKFDNLTDAGLIVARQDVSTDRCSC